MRAGRWRGVGLACLLAAGCGDGGSGARAPFEVLRDDRSFEDASRATPPTIAFAGAPTRTLPVLIWRPDVRGPRPVLLMAHGFGGGPWKFDAFAETIAAGGTIVAAPLFPLTNDEAPGGHIPGVLDFVNQPADLSFVIDGLFEEGRIAGGTLEGRIAEDALFVLGHSMGGATALGLTRKACCTDARVRATVLASVPWQLVFGLGLDPLAIGVHPTLVIHGTEDATVPFGFGLDLYERLGAPRWFVGIEGGFHSDAYESQEDPPVVPRDVAQRAVGAFMEMVLGAADGFDAELDAIAAEGHRVERDP